MAYSAFVAATKKDLDAQREYVTKQLRDSGIFVDPMENWPADSQDPASVSVARSRKCDFCIALIGFQAGTTAQADPQQRSITQMEVEGAIKNGVKTLVFLLRDSPANREAWPAEFIRMDDERFTAWRKLLETSMVCSYFDSKTMPEVLPAVTRQVIQWEERRRRRYIVGGAFATCILALTTSAYLTFTGVQDWVQSRMLAFHDPIVFQNSRDGSYNVARLLDGRSDIQDNTKFRDEILGTQKSFDLFANTFGSFRDYLRDFEDLAKRGVRIRFVLTDFSEENRANWDAFNNATEALPNTREETLFNARNIRDMIVTVQHRYPDRVELRLSTKPIFYTLWLRDPDEPSALAHLGVTYYGQKSNWPAFRMSRRNSVGQIHSLQEQFELLWRDAKPIG